MSKFFWPEYPNKDYIHSYFKRSLSADILDAFHIFTSNYEIDIKWKASKTMWYITINDKIVSVDHMTRSAAILWVLENWQEYVNK